MTPPPVDLEIVVPARNEELRLPQTLTKTVSFLESRGWSAGVVVVDSGSIDRTADVVRSFAGATVPVRLVSCGRPGKGRAVRAGLLSGQSRFVGFMDADLATPIETLDLFVPLLEAGAPAVIASRYSADATVVVRQSPLRRAGAAAFRAAARQLLPTVSDPQCGFKFFSGPVARATAAECRIDGFSFDVELLVRLWRQGWDITEVGVDWSNAAGSTFHPLLHGVQAFVELARIAVIVPRRAGRLGLPGESTGGDAAAA